MRILLSKQRCKASQKGLGTLQRRDTKGVSRSSQRRNRLNNDISNLELKSIWMHLSEHGKSHEEYNKSHIEEIRALASEWHGSEVGRAWHKIHAVEMWEGIEPKKYICKVCGKEFESRMLDTEKIKFCSNKCKAAARRKSRVDSVESICDWCGKKYTKNRYSKGTTCSIECRAKKRWSGYESKGGTIRG